MKAQALQYIGEDLAFQGRSTPLAEALGNYQRPTYIYDLGWIQRRVQAFKKALPPVRIHYAVKANTNLQLLKSLKQQALHVDVVSAGEIKHALTAGFQPQDVIFSGVGKTRDEIRYALGLGIYQINVESLPEIERIGRLAQQLGKTAAISLRLNPNIDIGTHPYIATGLRENKFGLDLEMVAEAAGLIRRYSSLSPVGLSFHLGSQMTDPSSLRKAFVDLKPVFLELRRQFSGFQRLDFGGGLGIHYEDCQGTEEGLLQEYGKIISEESKNFGAELQCEPGRWLVAHGGVYVVQVQYVKKTPHKTFLVVDGGMNHLLRPSLYQAHHEIYPLRRPAGRASMTYDVVGPICESADFLAKNRVLPETVADELIVVADTGAYGAVMASHYNLHELPLEICLE